MSAFEHALEVTVELLKNPLITKDQVRAHGRSMAWILERKDALEAAGWTVDDLYRVGTLSYPYSEWGPGWLSLWNHEKCEPRLGSRGNIEFVLHEPAGDVIQTCWLSKNYLT